MPSTTNGFQFTESDAEIVRYVVDERLEEGDRLPTEAEMLEEFGVGRGQ